MLQLAKLAIAAVLFFQCASSAQPPENLDQPISVCEVLENPSKFDGKLISIRGVWESGGEGSSIVSDAACSKPFKTYGYTWPQTIWIEVADSRLRLHKVNFHTDQEAFRKVNEEIRNANLDPKKTRLWLTFIGVFETREYSRADIGSDGKGGVRAYGFGHLNSAPGQILVKTVRDLEIERR